MEGGIDHAAAQTHLRLLAEARLRRVRAAPRYLWLDEDFRAGGQPPEEEGLLTLKAVASALTRVGAMDRVTAGAVVTGYAAALDARGLGDGRALSLDPSSGRDGSPRPPARVPGPPGGSLRAVPVGAVFTAELDGRDAIVHLLTLVLAPGLAAITMYFAMTWDEPGQAEAGIAGRPTFPPFGPSGAVDDLGRPYQLTFASAEARWRESGTLHLSPVPPPGTRWLELLAEHGAPAVRVDLGQQPARTTAQPARALAAGELLLDAVAQTLLGGGPMAGITAQHLAGSLAEVVAALEAARALPAASPAAARLAALCQRRGVEVRGDLGARAAATDLPESWADGRVYDPLHDGPDVTTLASAPVAAVLPEIDGARFVLAGLVSAGRLATLDVFAWGWRPEPRDFRLDQPLSWWALDDTGCWHVGRLGRWHEGELAGSAGEAHLQLQLSTPLDPAATELEVLVSGSASRVTATVPLAWQGR